MSEEIHREANEMSEQSDNKIKPIDLTTPLNLEMIKELRSMLADLIKLREMDEQSVSLVLTNERQQMLQIRDSVTRSVMRAIECFCIPFYWVQKTGNELPDKWKGAK